MLQVGKVARSSRLLRILREVGVAGDRPATPEAAREFRQALEELGTTYVKLGQLLSSRPDLMPDVYIEELTRLVDEGAARALRGAAAGDPALDRRERVRQHRP